MNEWRQFLAGLICYICFVRLIEQFLPKESYRKYVRFFTGLLFIVLAVTPLMELKNVTGELEKNLRTSQGRSEAFDIRIAQQEILDLQSEEIEREYEKQQKEQRESGGAADE